MPSRSRTGDLFLATVNGTEVRAESLNELIAACRILGVWALACDTLTALQSLPRTFPVPKTSERSPHA